MKHPFKVGDTYRNELGNYQVLSINEPNMLIRYDDGGEQEAEIAFQRRIWERIKDEEEVALAAELKKTKAKTKRRSSTARLGTDFSGMEESDFQTSISGTSWRARSGLGGLLALRLSTISGREFESRAVARQPRVFITLPNPATPKASVHQAKFVFGVDETEAYHGFYIEKNSDEMDDSWDWPRLVGALRDNLALRRTIQDAMEEYDLVWQLEIYDSDGAQKPIVTVAVEADGLNASVAGSDTVRTLEWADFPAYLDELDDEDWCNLYLAQHISQENAIDLGTGIADEVGGVWNALMPLYDACAQQG